MVSTNQKFTVDAQETKTKIRVTVKKVINHREEARDEGPENTYRNSLNTVNKVARSTYTCTRNYINVSGLNPSRRHKAME